MAKPPFLSLKKEDFPEVKEKWIDKLFHALNEYSKRNEYALVGRLNITDNLNAYWKKMTIAVKEKNSRITTVPHAIGSKQVGRDISFNGTWSAASATLVPPYIQRHGELVFVNGSCVAGASGVTTLIFKLPAEYRPRTDIRYAITFIDPGANPNNAVATGRLWFRANGDVEITAANGSSTIPVNSVFTFNQTFTLEYLSPSTFTGPSLDTVAFPFKFKNEIKDSKFPLAVFIASAYEVTDNKKARTPVSLFGVAYDIQGSDIFVYNIGGALTGKTYEITLLVVGD